MKRYSLFIAVLSCCTAFFTSCTDDDKKVSTVEPGIYFIEKEIGAQIQKEGKPNRGVSGGNFNTSYDPDYIYLHKKGSDDAPVSIPVYSCDECTESGKGFRYRLEVMDDGSAVLTPINEDGTYAESSLTIASGESCYFSSWESNTWKLQDDQVEEIEIDADNSYNWFRRKNSVNKEIYCSDRDFTVDDLANLVSVDEPLRVSRACAGFNVVGLFYDGDQAAALGDNPGMTQLTAEEFENIMGSDPSEWYIKIFIGGDDFPEEYNIETKESVGNKGGFYSTNDVNWFESGNEDKNEFLKFSETVYSTGQQLHYGFGYYTQSGNHLFTPVSGDEPVELYVLIKHWTGAGEPDEEWLSDNSKALMTKVNIRVISHNGIFYTMGLMMDIQQFKNAWYGNGGDAAESAKATRNAIGIREFTLKDAIVIFEAY